MSEKNEQTALRNLHVNTAEAVVNNTCAPPIWNLVSEECEKHFSDTAQQKARDPLGEITVTFSGSSNLAEIQKQYNG